MEQIISQKKALEIIKAYIKQHGYPPTQRELAAEFLNCFRVDDRRLPAGNVGGGNLRNRSLQ